MFFACPLISLEYISGFSKPMRNKEKKKINTGRYLYRYNNQYYPIPCIGIYNIKKRRKFSMERFLLKQDDKSSTVWRLLVITVIFFGHIFWKNSQEEHKTPYLVSIEQNFGDIYFWQLQRTIYSMALTEYKKGVATFSLI
jgi:hypothetical protein